MRTVSVDAARRIALGAQGFGRPQPAGRVDVRHFRRTMDGLGLVQLDSVNVCVRTHYMPFYSRLGPYDRNRLDRWLNDSGENIEYWAHEASVFPVTSYPLWRWRMADVPPWRRALALMEEHPGVIDSVYRQVRDHGPLTVQELDAPNHRNEPWWGYGPGKIALEYLFRKGDISALRARNFVRRYDLPDRLLPAGMLDRPMISKERAYRELLGRAVRHHGIGTALDIIDYYRLHAPTARPILASLAREGRIQEVTVPGWRGPVYLDPDARRPRAITGSVLLSPFDPVVWYRERAERLFGFRYRIEIYVPERQRVFGYYVLPFMVDGHLVGRVDCKADREARALVIRGAFSEAGTDRDRVGDALAAELRRFAVWLGLDSIVVEPNGDLAPALARRT